VYSILDAREITVPDPHDKSNRGNLVQYKLVRLKDPWAGSEEWKGFCSDYDEEFWTKEAKAAFSKRDQADEEAAESSEVLSQRCLHSWANKSDGVFAMKLEDFMQHFNHLTICHHGEDHRYFERSYFYQFSPSYGALSSKTQEWLQNR